MVLRPSKQLWSCGVGQLTLPSSLTKPFTRTSCTWIACNCQQSFLNEQRQYYIINLHESTVSHFSYAPLVQCKITRKRNMIFLFWDYQRKAHLYLHQSLKCHCNQIKNEWENGSESALPSKHHFTLHDLEWNSDHIALFSGSNFCYARDKSRFILGHI